MPHHLLAPLFALAASIAIAAEQPAATHAAASAPQQSASDAAAWNVQNPPGDRSEAIIDTDEGTWISLDVSPDGTEIAFDLLGDIYLLPITGGDARPITSGVAWDMQPRFSPDGTEIAFTSDRGGGDNIWVMKRDGSEPRQVTKETFRLLNSPVWTPDGQFIAARKHFTSRRSLGAGEIWLYHKSGGFDGLQMTTRPTEQKDVGEPAFSPDGRYLYYSLDATPGDTFEYSKDSNPGIYAIDRLDRTTGRTERFIAGPGGACRPTPSPDGKRIAFVRRVRFQTTLFVQDLDSGLARPIYGDLERDMQETWAIHGVYPSIAWTPDSKSIIAYAKGKIRRINADTGESEIIPFRVKGTRSVARAVRLPVEVAPDEFEVKMPRSVRVSPRGDMVAYQALGHIYVRPLPDGTPRRLTRQTRDFEFFPSFSRDGKWIVYASWNDDDLGAIRIAPAQPEGCDEGRIITPEPSHYVDPVFTPDGTQVVFGKVSGGYLTSPLWSRDPGVYRVPAEGGEMVLITRTGTNPQFGDDPTRLFLMTVERQKDADRRALVSMDLDGSDVRTHYVTENGVEFAISPDGKWIAWSERFKVFVAPFVPTGREIAIGPKSKALPITQVSDDSGWNLHWSGDSARLHWTLGPTLYTRDIAHQAGDEASPQSSSPSLSTPNPRVSSPPAPSSLNNIPDAINISFTYPYHRPRYHLALTNARIITMNGDEVIENGAILIHDNRIAAVGPAATMSLPADATIIDCTGMTITPGFIDVHAHGSYATNGITPQRNWQQYANLAFGVTTCHDPSNDTQSVFAAAELAKAGLVTLPRTFSTGTILYGAAGPARAEIESLDDALFHLRRLKAAGAISVKSYNQPRRDQRQQVIEAARRLGLMVVPEGGSLFQHNMTMVVDGHTGVEHSLPVERIYKDVVQLWSATDCGYTPTLGVAFGGIAGENYWYDKTDVWTDERLLAFTPRAVIDPRSRRRTKAPDEEYNHFRAARNAKDLLDSGVSVQMGAHGQLAGLAAHWEIWMLVQGGLTPHEALRSATLHGARYLGMDRDLGSIEPGKLADLVVMAKNPLEDIANTHSVRYTILNGEVYDAATMARLTPNPTPAPVWFFHELQSGRGVIPSTAGMCEGCTAPGASCTTPPWHREPEVSGYR